MKKQLLSAPLAALVIAGMVTWQIGCGAAAPWRPNGAHSDAPELTAKSESNPAPAPLRSQPEASGPTKTEPAAQAMPVEMPRNNRDSAAAPQADKLMTEGVTYIRTNKYPEAVNAFQEILKIVKDDNPLMPVAYYNLACTYALMTQSKPALEYLGKAIKAGYDNRETIEADPDLVSLHEMPEYKAALDLIPPIVAIKSTAQDDADQKEALKLIEDIRGLKCKTEPQYKIMAPDQFERAYGGGRANDSIQGFYRWADKTLYIKQGLDPVRFKGTRIHETFHALQDQLFGMGQMQESVKTTDGNYALLALIEGDATLTFIECMPESMAKVMIASATPWRMMGGEPKYDQSQRGEANMRQGAYGYSIAARFVKAVKDAKGWEAVNAMYTNIPKSTEQVLHPEKYLANEQPVEVSVPDVPALLGAGWTASRPDTVGEFGLLLGLLSNPKSGPLAEEATMGWAGDKFVVIGNKDANQGFAVSKSAWDTARDAREFFDAMTLAMEETGQVRKDGNTATAINGKGEIDYLGLNGVNVVLVNNLPPEFKDKVIETLSK